MIFIKYVLENGVEFSKFLTLFLYILPWLLIYIIPISFFIIAIFLYNKMIASNEIIVLKGSGLNNFQISSPVIFLGMILTLLTLVISFYAMPYSNKQLRLTKMNFENNYSNLSFNSRVFESIKGLTIYVNDKKFNNLYGVLISDQRKDGSDVTITAERAELEAKENNLLLFLKNGTIQKYDNKEMKSQIINFDNYVFNLSENNSVKKNELKWKRKERYFHELLDYKSQNLNRDEIDSYKAELHQRIIYPLMSVVLAFISSAIMINSKFNRRSNIFAILKSFFIGLCFIVGAIFIFKMMEKNILFVSLAYANIFLYLIFSAVYLFGFNNIKINIVKS